MSSHLTHELFLSFHSPIFCFLPLSHKKQKTDYKFSVFIVLAMKRKGEKHMIFYILLLGDLKLFPHRSLSSSFLHISLSPLNFTSYSFLTGQHKKQIEERRASKRANGKRSGAKKRHCPRTILTHCGV